MPIYTLAPEADTYDTITDTEAGYLADASDATLVTVNHTTTGYHKIAFDTPSTPSGELVSVVPGLRVKRTGADVAYVSVCRRSGSRFYHYQLPTFSPTESLADYDWAAVLGSVAVNGLTDPDDAYLMVDDNGYPASLSIATAWAYAYYLAAATVAAPSAPSGTITDQAPTLTATVSSVVEDWQDGWLCGHTVEFAVYNDADVTGDDPPDGITPEWTDTVRATISTYGDGSTATTQDVSMDVDTALVDGDYITFVRVSRDLPTGQELYWSDWSKSASAWTIDSSPPDSPTAMTATADDDTGLVAIVVTAPTTAGYETDATCHVQRSDDLGVTWEDVSGMTEKAITLGGGATALGNDYRAPAGSTTLQYRARVTALLVPHAALLNTGLTLEATVTGALVVSDWLTITGQTGPAVFDGWRFIPVDDTSAAWASAKIARSGGDVETEDRDSAVFAPIDGSYTKVVTGPSRGVFGSYTFTATTSAEETSMLALVAQTGTILMTNPRGTTRFIAWSGAPKTTYLGIGSCVFTTVDIDYVETDAPS